MTAQTHPFKTEVRQLLDLVIHSLYSKKEIFLRELISNASDAIDRARFEALTHKALQREEEAWKISIFADKKSRTLTITDNGIGMTARELEENIGTIASSGTRRFLDWRKTSAPSRQKARTIRQRHRHVGPLEENIGTIASSCRFVEKRRQSRGQSGADRTVRGGFLFRLHGRGGSLGDHPPRRRR
jgi:hypothetical protein